MRAVFVVTLLIAVGLAAYAAWRLRWVAKQAKSGGESPGSPPLSSVRSWARDRRCAMCDVDLNGRGLHAGHVALLDPGGGTRDWPSIPAADLPVALATCLPVCWNCHVAETFRRTHPDLVTERDDSVVHVKGDRER